MSEAKEPAKPEDFARLFSEFQMTYGSELRAKVKRLDKIIGRKHWLSVGTYKENLIRAALAAKLPKEYEIGTGFVMAKIGTERVLSKQIDLLIWNSHAHAPFFRDGEVVIIAPEALVGAIEVKSTLTTAELKKSLVNLDSLMRFEHFYGPNQVIHRSIFAFGKGKKFNYPVSAFNSLNRHLQTFTEFPLARRYELTANRDRWSLPWITNIAILDHGVLNCNMWSINHSDRVTYAAYSTDPKKKDQIDAYGFIERSLLMDLMLGYKKAFARYTLPGYTSALFSNTDRFVDTDRYILLPDAAVTQFGSLVDAANEAWVKAIYHPPAVAAEDKGDEVEDDEAEEVGEEAE